MSAGPLVSVVVPVFNGSLYLRDALESVFAQTWCEREVIVVDDGSSDASNAIARQFDVHLLAHEQRTGIASARNAGLRAARGEIFAFLDHDDLWLPQALERHVEALHSAPDSLSVIHEVLFLDGLTDWPHWMQRRAAELSQPHPAWVPSGFAVRRSTFLSVGWFDETFAHADDLDWFARARVAGIGSVVTPQVLLRRRIHASNDSHHTSVQTELMQALRKSAGRSRVTAPAALEKKDE